jgi:hypothetical protein
MDHLNTIQPKQDAGQFLQQLQQVQPAQSKYQYLDKKTLERHMAELHDMEFRRLATEADLRACNEAAKAFTYAVANIDRYALLMGSLDISKDEVLRRG